MSALETTYRPVDLYCKDGPLLASDGALSCLALFYVTSGLSILSATITPNPADINSKVLLSVTVAEEEMYLEPDFFYSGEFFSGEV